jgi:hypothetical protein
MSVLNKTRKLSSSHEPSGGASRAVTLKKVNILKFDAQKIYWRKSRKVLIGIQFSSVYLFVNAVFCHILGKCDKISLASMTFISGEPINKFARFREREA